MKVIIPLLALALAAASQPDFMTALAGIATAAHWQRVALVQLGLVGGAVCTVGVFVVVGFVWGAADYWLHERNHHATD